MNKKGLLVVATVCGLKYYTFCPDEDTAYDVFKERITRLNELCKEPKVSDRIIAEAFNEWEYNLDKHNNIEIFPCRYEGGNN